MPVGVEHIDMPLRQAVTHRQRTRGVSHRRIDAPLRLQRPAFRGAEVHVEFRVAAAHGLEQIEVRPVDPITAERDQTDVREESALARGGHVTEQGGRQP